MKLLRSWENWACNMHIPVLLNEVLKYLDPKPNENFIDCTFGAGGHARAILEKNKPDGKVLGIDADLERIERIESGIINHELRKRLILVNGNFADLKEIINRYDFKPVQGILFDIGLSSWQIEKSKRGFSFQRDEDLDMRLNPKNSLTAQEILNKWPEKDLIKIFQEFGQERFSRRIAENIIKERKIRPIKTTLQLIEIIKKSIPFSKTRRGGITRVAARIFQALRIAVNNELDNLRKALPQCLEILEPGGRIVVISFHSLEDRIVKQFLREEKTKKHLVILTKKPVGSSQDELKRNPRSRSAKLRAGKKLIIDN